MTVEFAQYGHKIVVTRAGRIGDSSLATKVENSRTAEGGSHFAPFDPNLPCLVPTYEFSSNGGCGKTFTSSGDLSFSYSARGLGLEVTRSTKRKSGFGNPNGCGEDPQTGINEPFTLAWPTQPKLESSPSVTARELFGGRHAIIALLRNSDVGKPVKVRTRLGIAPLTGSEEESATNQATVRLIRVPAP
ncbi:MAG: hypothetical protein JST31_03710 [Actinobacteria bacterium]|nr:hypothetical protein [Actinomycetota bacterium]